MKTKTITCTLPQLCKELELEEKHIFVNLRIENGNLENDYYGVVVEIGDKIKMDECEHCGKTESAHSKWVHYVAQPERMRNDKSFPFPCDDFKPLLATVKSIRLAERCECGHDKHGESYADENAVGEVMKVRGCDSDCICDEFKPVQMVEIEVGV